MARSSWRFRAKAARTRERATPSCCLISRSAAVMAGSLDTGKVSGADATVPLSHPDRLLAARRTWPTTVLRCCTVNIAEHTSSANSAMRAVCAVFAIAATAAAAATHGACVYNFWGIS